MPLIVSIGEALKFLGSDIVIEVLSEWVDPGSLSFSILLGSNIMLWLVWDVWGVGFQGACSGVSGTIVMPFSVSVSEAFKLLRSNIIVEISSEWISVISSFNLSSDVMLWLVWLVWGKIVLGA